MGDDQAPFGDELRRRRVAKGWGQVGLAFELRRLALSKRLPEPALDGNGVSRWERGRQLPDAFYQLLLCQLFDCSADDLGLGSPSRRRPTLEGGAGRSSPSNPGEISGDGSALTMDDVTRREFLRLFSITTAAITVDPSMAGLDWERLAVLAARPSQIDDAALMEHHLLNGQLWTLYRGATRKRDVLDQARHHARVLTTCLQETMLPAQRRRLFFLTGDLFQLVGEILFDLTEYADAAQAYATAATASKEADAFDLWACSMVRHAFIPVYEHRYQDAVPMLDMAATLSRRGDPSMSTSQWVAAVRAQALAGIGDVSGCNSALDTAEEVRGLTGKHHNGGWLRFDHDRLAEERGACMVVLGRPEEAEHACMEALAQNVSPRRRGFVLTNLALAATQRGQLDKACAFGEQVVGLVQQGGSGAVRSRLHELGVQLAPFSTLSAVRQLNDRIPNA